MAHHLGSDTITTTLTPIDHLMPRNYVIGSMMCFSLSRRANVDEIYEHLNIGLQHTLKQIPFLAGAVVSTGASGKHQIDTRSEDFGKKKVIFNDLRSGNEKDWPHSYKSLRKANFPSNIISDECLSPVTEYMKMEEMPVIAAQANFIDGGLILHLSVLHTACDVLAWNNVLTLLASNVRSSWAEAESERQPETIHPSYLDRSPLMHGNTYVRRVDVREYRLQAANATLEDPRKYLIDATPTSIADMEEAVFSISKTNLVALRDAISGTDASASWVTVNDALAGFLWHCINRARIGPNMTLKGNLSVAYDGRSVLDPPLPQKFMGNAALGFPITLPIHPSSIYEAAKAISEARSEFSDKHLRNVLGFLEGLDDMTEERVMYAKTLNPTLVVSNLKDMGYYKLDWGTNLSFIDCMRMAHPFRDCLPRVLPMPAQRDGTVDLTVWIEKTAMKRLREDKFWCEWTDASA